MLLGDRRDRREQHDPRFRRVELVRLVRHAGRTTAEAVVVLHRYPQTVPVSLGTAERLVAAGAPLDVVDRRPRVAPC